MDETLMDVTELHVEGTIMDPAYLLRRWEETRGALWVWDDWQAVMAYRDWEWRSKWKGD